MSIKPSVVFLFLIVIIVFPLFSHLDAPPLRQWDEARLANNALEMSHSHNWIVTTMRDSPDMWSTKPPFMIWMQVIMIKLIGASELAVRLPSAFAALFTCLFLFFLFSKRYKEPVLGLISAVILMTSQGYVYMHGTRSGDYDPLLTLFMVAYSFSYFLYIEKSDARYLYATFMLLILAALTKGVESLIFLPGLFIYALYRRKLITTLKQKETYIGIAAFIIFVFGYYLLRDHYNPGYISAVEQNELGARYNTVIENHQQGDWYYFELLIGEHFHAWYLFVIPGLIAGFLSKRKEIKEITIFSFTIAFTYLLIVSGAKTKLPWYSMPAMPFLAVLSGIFIYFIYSILKELQSPLKYMSYNPLPLIFLFLVFIFPYSNILNECLTVKAARESPPEEADMGQFLKDVFHHEHKLDSCAFLNTDCQQNYYWYIDALKYEQRPIKLIDTSEIAQAYSVVVSRPDLKKYIDSNYNTHVEQTFGTVTVYKINGRKS